MYQQVTRGQRNVFAGAYWPLLFKHMALYTLINDAFMIVHVSLS